MRILVELGHPAQVHTMKNTMSELKRNGHTLLIAIRERESMVGKLLKSYGYKYHELQPASTGLVNKFIDLIRNDLSLLKITKKFKPDMFLGPVSVYSSHVSAIRRRDYICYADGEPIKGNKIQYYLFKPFVKCIITPEKYRADMGKGHIRVKSYKELAYLHPNRFKPDKKVLQELGVEKGEKYILLRFSSFDASHDIGLSGFSSNDKKKLIKELKKHARLFISSETELPREFKKYELPTKVERMHHVIYYATLLVGDTQTSTTEAACLGTPAIRSNKWVGPDDMSNFLELEKRYGLIFNIRDPEKAIKKAVELIKKSDLKREWNKKRKKLLKDKIDLTSFFVWFVENYPQSQRTMKKNPKLQNRFR